jgi:hypothetical protein
MGGGDCLTLNQPVGWGGQPRANACTTREVQETNAEERYGGGGGHWPVPVSNAMQDGGGGEGV